MQQSRTDKALSSVVVVQSLYGRGMETAFGFATCRALACEPSGFHVQLISCTQSKWAHKYHKIKWCICPGPKVRLPKTARCNQIKNKSLLSSLHLSAYEGCHMASRSSSLFHTKRTLATAVWNPSIEWAFAAPSPAALFHFGMPPRRPVEAWLNVHPWP